MAQLGQTLPYRFPAVETTNRLMNARGFAALQLTLHHGWSRGTITDTTINDSQ